MNVFHSCDGTAIFIRSKMKCPIQLVGRGPVGPTMHPPGQIFMGAKLFPRVYSIRRIFVSMNKLIPTICNLTVSMATHILLN